MKKKKNRKKEYIHEVLMYRYVSMPYNRVRTNAQIMTRENKVVVLYSCTCTRLRLSFPRQCRRELNYLVGYMWVDE